MKVWNLTNLRVLDSNITIIFSKIFAIKFPNRELLLKNVPIRHFWTQTLKFWRIFGKLCNQTLLRVPISDMTIVVF